MTVESFVSVTNQFRIEKESDWFVDNGATVHVTKDQQIFKEFREFNEKREIKTAKGNLEAIGEGTVPVEMLIKGRWHQKKLLNVWYVPNISRNLFSVTAEHDKNKDRFQNQWENCDGWEQRIWRRTVQGSTQDKIQNSRSEFSFWWFDASAVSWENGTSEQAPRKETHRKRAWN